MYIVTFENVNSTFTAGSGRFSQGSRADDKILSDWSEDSVDEIGHTDYHIKGVSRSYQSQNWGILLGHTNYRILANSIPPPKQPNHLREHMTNLGCIKSPLKIYVTIVLYMLYDINTFMYITRWFLLYPYICVMKREEGGVTVVAVLVATIVVMTVGQGLHQIKTSHLIRAQVEGQSLVNQEKDKREVVEMCLKINWGRRKAAGKHL